VLDPMTAYQITSMMEGVVTRGTAPARSISIARRRQDRHHQRGKGRLVHRLHRRTGDRRLHRLRQSDTDGPRFHRRRAGSACLQRVHGQGALEGTRPADFRVPEGMKLIEINRKTGMQAFAGEGDVIMEAFKPGTGPADSYRSSASRTSPCRRGSAQHIAAREPGDPVGAGRLVLSPGLSLTVLYIAPMRAYGPRA
jgi:penicillin-binding protein 1A